MPVWAWILIAVVVVGVAAAAYRQRRTRALRDRFGPEYERAMTEQGGRRKGEEALRLKRMLHA